MADLAGMQPAKVEDYLISLRNQRLASTVLYLVTPEAGDVWFASSVMAGLLLFGLAVFLFCFGVLPYWFKVHKHLHEILGCTYSFPADDFPLWLLDN